MPDGLLEGLGRLSEVRGCSVSALVREACEGVLAEGDAFVERVRCAHPRVRVLNGGVKRCEECGWVSRLEVRR
jgi:hypothetical protein